MPVFRHLERLTSSLASALSVDDVARIALTGLLAVEDVSRVGLALSQGGGRELRFVSSDADALAPQHVRWCTIDGLADVPLAHTVRTGQAVYLGDEQVLEQHYPGIAERQRSLGTRSMASLPLVVGSSCLGGLLVCWSSSQEHGAAQQGFLSAFAAQVAQAVRRGLVYQTQRSTSEELQRSLLPHSLPDVERLDFGAHYQPAGAEVDVGGDWYDVLQLPDGSVAVSLGDVMGKGVPAAVVMGEVRAAARAYALLDPDPSRVLERLHRLVQATATAEQLITMVFGIVDAGRTELRLAVAGHPPPLLVPASGAPSLLDAPLGPALGVAAGPWPTRSVPLGPRDSVLLYSDGLVETRTRDLSEGLEVLLGTVSELGARQRNPRELCARVTAVLSDGTNDDVTLLAVAAAAERRTAARNLPADATSAGAARQFVVTTLRDWEVDEEVVERAELCVSELVTNVIIHSGAEPTVGVSTDGEDLLLTVHDTGGHRRISAPEQADPEEVSGRGLALVQAMARAWNVEHTTSGTSVWCELALDPAALDLDLDLGWDDIAS